MDLTTKHCVPCEGGMPPMPDADENIHMAQVTGWKLDRSDTHQISKQFIRKNFREAMAFVDEVAKLAEHEGHHPDILIKFNCVTFTNYTHAVEGLTENDFILAAKIDQIEHRLYS